MEKDIYNLKLHESLELKEGIIILRVAGGWIYNCWDYEKQNYIVGNFIPFNDEFQNKTKTLKELFTTEEKANEKVVITLRKADFDIKVHEKSNDYTELMKSEFIDYWTEYGENDRKMRFEKETSFNIERRLKTWFNRSKTSSQTNGVNQLWDK